MGRFATPVKARPRAGLSWWREGEGRAAHTRLHVGDDVPLELISTSCSSTDQRLTSRATRSALALGTTRRRVDDRAPIRRGELLVLFGAPTPSRKTSSYRVVPGTMRASVSREKMTPVCRAASPGPN